MRKSKVALFAAFVFAAGFCHAASFGPLTPSAKPCEREYIWPEGKMPDAQPHQIAAKTGEKKMPGFKADDFRRPYIVSKQIDFVKSRDRSCNPGSGHTSRRAAG